LVPTVVTLPDESTGGMFQLAAAPQFAKSPVPAGREPTPVTLAVAFPGMVSLCVA
jgi:hypothetical protein